MSRYCNKRSFGRTMIFTLLAVITQLISCRMIHAFTITSRQRYTFIAANTALAPLALEHHHPNVFDDQFSEKNDFKRRDLLKTVLTPCVGLAVLFTTKEVANALTDAATSDTVATGAVEMTTFIDPQGLFALKIPKSFFAIRRTSKGDLPDASTGSGRRGSSIFNAGDLAKAEVLAIERFPTRVLLEEYGIDSSGSLSTFPDIGEPSAIANLIAIRRDREKPNASNAAGTSNTQIVPNSLLISADGRELSFSLRTAIDVQKPELLLEQYGVSTLNRITAAKASLRSNDGYMMAVFASALETDWQGPDGLALQDAVNSFQAIDQANTWPLADKFVMIDQKDSV